MVLRSYFKNRFSFILKPFSFFLALMVGATLTHHHQAQASHCFNLFQENSRFKFIASHDLRAQGRIHEQLSTMVSALFGLSVLIEKEPLGEFVNHRTQFAKKIRSLKLLTRDETLQQEVERLYREVSRLEKKVIRAFQKKKGNKRKKKIVDLLKSIRGNIGELCAAMNTRALVRRSLKYGDVAWLYGSRVADGKKRSEFLTETFEGHPRFTGEIDFIFDHGFGWAEVKTSTTEITRRKRGLKSWLKQAARMKTFRKILEDQGIVAPGEIKLHFISSRGIDPRVSQELLEAGYDFVHARPFLDENH